tara:strand:+ start:468 stop:2399 length:1932 start_codon:yes stop_codon:yes gene_type:complete
MENFLQNVLVEYRSSENKIRSDAQELMVRDAATMKSLDAFPLEVLYKITEEDCEKMLTLCETENICTDKKLEELYQLYFKKTKKNVTMKEFSNACLKAKFIEPLTQKTLLFLKYSGLVDPLGLIWKEVNEEYYNENINSLTLVEDNTLVRNNLDVFTDQPNSKGNYYLDQPHDYGKEDMRIITENHIFKSEDRFFVPCGDLLRRCRGVMAGGFLSFIYDCTAYGRDWKVISNEDVFTEDFGIPSTNLSIKFDKVEEGNYDIGYKDENNKVILKEKHGYKEWLELLRNTKIVKNQNRYFQAFYKNGELGYVFKEISKEDVFENMRGNTDFRIENDETDQPPGTRITLRKQFIPLKNIPHLKSGMYLIPYIDDDTFPTLFNMNQLPTCWSTSKFRESVPDIDLYMTQTDAQIFITNFCKLNEIRDVTLKFIYSNIANNPQQIKYHFLIKAKILNPLGGHKLVDIDLVIVKDPQIVISHFDLTICQIGFHWKNGRYETFATKDAVHDIRKKIGRLTGNFINEFENGNKITHNRVKKYMKRGYTMDLSNVKKLSNLNYDGYNAARSSLPNDVRELRKWMCPKIEDRRDNQRLTQGFFSDAITHTNHYPYEERLIYFLRFYDEENVTETKNKIRSRFNYNGWSFLQNP